MLHPLPAGPVMEGDLSLRLVWQGLMSTDCLGLRPWGQNWLRGLPRDHGPPSGAQHMVLCLSQVAKDLKDSQERVWSRSQVEAENHDKGR